ncbi:MAG: AAA family ATPase [Richelia sp. RM2_1_2]|nr:AAA family ATPase [Richelia sp. RM1_1_1]NJO30062.1 AAA family ATPase [Richelia sp. SL_2_1]NJO65058.1 AAA family ATPase [Richelia sp. RM2_1_2]
MHIEKLHIQNFRGFEEITLNFPKSNTAVFIGINGAGKSSILDCIAIMLAQFVAELRNEVADIELSENDIKINSQSTVNNITILIGDAERISWEMIEEGLHQQNHSKFDEIENYIQHLQENLESQPDLNLPVMVYYQTHRMVLKNPYTFSLKKNKQEKYYQFFAYQKAFSSEINNFQDFFDWFKEEEDYENEIRLRENADYRNPRLSIIRGAITNFFNNFYQNSFSNLRVVRSISERFMRNSGKPSLTITKNNQDFKIEQLSDGEKMLLMLVTDLARRLAIANPNSRNALLNGEGIVLIDEIDLHLHPQWQRSVIPSLTQTFPNCQFIVTTHSPQVLSEVKRENVFIIENYQIVENTPHTYGKDSNSILYELMDVKERPETVQNQINNCLRLIDNGQIETAKSALNELSNLLGENDSEVVRANTLIGFLGE